MAYILKLSWSIKNTDQREATPTELIEVHFRLVVILS